MIRRAHNGSNRLGDGNGVQRREADHKPRAEQAQQAVHLHLQPRFFGAVVVSGTEAGEEITYGGRHGG